MKLGSKTYRELCERVSSCGG